MHFVDNEIAGFFYTDGPDSEEVEQGAEPSRKKPKCVRAYLSGMGHGDGWVSSWGGDG